MEEKNYAILVSNAGVIVVHKRIRILIDGLYKDLGGNFSQLPDWAWKTMQQGKGELGNVEYLLFSHSHFDHYYAPYVDTYLENNQVKGILFPPVDDTKGLEEQVKTYAHKAISLDANGETIIADDVKLRVFTTRHVDKKYYDVQNQCIQLEVDGKRLTFLSDVDYYEEEFAKLEDFTTDVAFVTPVFYNNPKGRRILRDVLHAKTIVIYHLPSEEDDRFMFCKMAFQDVKRYSLPEQEETLIWTETGNRIEF